eukprot:240574-Amphidinium_carterae.1
MSWREVPPLHPLPTTPIRSYFEVAAAGVSSCGAWLRSVAGTLAIGTEVFGENQNHPSLHHLLVFSDDIYVLALNWAKALKSIRSIRIALQTNSMDIAVHKTERLEWSLRLASGGLLQYRRSGR